jgi:hypothetical protein
MLEIERLGEAFANLATAAGEVALALGETAVALISALPVDEIAEQLAAYQEAGNEHPEWVHMANYSKKKRIRKKYHDRIMRQYRRAENG